MSRRNRMGVPRRFARPNPSPIQRSKFDRSHGHKTAFDGGDLVPVYVDEVLPGDTFTMRASFVARFGTLLVPIMDQVYLESFFFFVPMRLLWENAHRFFGEEENPGSSTDFNIPTTTLPVGGIAIGSIYDHMGIPIAGSASAVINVLPFRAYNKVWSDWFRLEHVQNRPTLLTHGGGDANTAYFIRRRNKRPDYFTSALSAPQRGSAIALPIGGHPVIGTPASGPSFTNDGGTTVRQLTATSPAVNVDLDGDPVGSGTLLWDTPALQLDPAWASAATINDLRETVQIQRWFEKQNRGGTRYTEMVEQHFHVRDAGGDARLNRAEYLGGHSQLMSVIPVPQQSEAGTTPQANLSAYGVFPHSKASWTKSFTEHGYVLGLVNVRADLTYSQGINKMYLRETKFDFYWPTFAHLGEQPIEFREIYAPSGNSVWGYQERYAEYRYKPSEVSNIMRPGVTGNIAIWHCGQEFVSAPNFNAGFFEDDPPFDRNVATPSEPHILLDAYFNLTCARPMPVFGVPGHMDHF